MSAESRCQGCDALLPSADAICARCDAELSPPPAPAGRFVCPHCQGRFDSLTAAPWPPKVRWWQPTWKRLQCPHCSTPLRDRYVPQPPGWLFVAVVAGAVAAQLFTTGWTRFALGLGLITAMYAPLAWAVWRHRQHHDDPQRYVAGSTRFWARGVTRATPRPRASTARPGGRRG